MAAISLPRPDDIPPLPEQSQIQLLDLLFEPSPAIHTALLPVLQSATYPAYPDLIDACYTRLESLANPSPAAGCPSPVLLSILSSHPRLGAKKVDSVQSVAEQANLQGEGEELARLNEEYEAKFPGLRFVVFVNGRGRPEIMRDMRTRIDRGDFTEEVQEALRAMRDIAKDRAQKLLGNS